MNALATDPKADVSFFFGTPVRDGERPLVVLAHELHPEDDTPGNYSSELRRVQYFVIVPGDPVIGREMDVDQGLLASVELGEELPMPALQGLALSRAELHLQELSAPQAQPIILTELSKTQISTLALCKEYDFAWPHVYGRTRNRALRATLKRFKKLADLGLEFREPPEVKLHNRFMS